jgi:hypothetical protein
MYYTPGPGPGIDSFYQYSTNTTVNLYNLSFSDLGEGNGNYVTDFNGANGKVFKFIMPVAGVKQGRYEPVQVLITPKKQQIINLGLDYKFSAATLLKTEFAMSNNDVNTFSSKDDGDDKGYAAKFQLFNTKTLQAARKLQLTTGLDYEYVQDKFKPLERLRSVEFSRDWGLPFLVKPATENIIRANAALNDKTGHMVSYQFTNYHRGDGYNGFQHSVLHTIILKGWTFNNQFIITQFKSVPDKGVFVRPVIDLSKQLRKMNNWRLGFRYALEKNNVRNTIADTLTLNAFSFDTYSVYFRSDEMRKNRFGITFFTRADKYPMGKALVRGDRSLNLNLQTELLANPKRQLYLNTTFRKLKVQNAAVSKQKEDETILGRAEYVMNEWKGLVNGSVLYEVGAGQEQKRDYAYLEVPAGTGQFAWIDYNNDGIQQLNEFELAAFPDQARFIRIFTPTNEFIKANYITFNYSFNINPRAILNTAQTKGMKNFLSRINLLTSLQTGKKSLSRGSFEFNPFKYAISDTDLVTLNTSIVNTFSFNRFSSKWGFDLSNFRNNGKSLLTYGYETRRLNDWLLKFRWNLGKSVAFVMNGKKGLNSLITPQFGNRNYHLDVYSIEPQLIYVRGTSFRVVTGYKYDYKKNKPFYGGENSSSNSINVETKYSLLQNSSVTGKFTFNNIAYKFPTNTTVSYIMLDGLLPGKNYLWALSFTKRLLNNLEFSVQYDGRKPGNAKSVHVGRLTLTALF